MSLDWNLQNVKNFKEKCFFETPEGGEQLTATAEVLIFATMSIGMHEITEKNCEEFFRRIMLHEEVYGPMRKNQDGEGVYFTFEEIEDLIGLRTNASILSKAKFKGVVLEALERVARGRVRREAAERQQKTQKPQERKAG